MSNKALVNIIKEYVSTQILPVALDRPFDVVMQYEAEVLADIIERDYLLIPRITPLQKEAVVR
jgi:hypothetical protein